MTDRTLQALKQAIFAIPSDQLVSRDIIIHAITNALSAANAAQSKAAQQDKKDAATKAVDICIEKCNSGNARKVLRDMRTRIIDAAIQGEGAPT